mgnify:CR=1 FL=1
MTAIGAHKVARYRASASCHVGIGMPARASLSLASAAYCGRRARIGTSATLTGTRSGSTASRRPISFASSNHVVIAAVDAVVNARRRLRSRAGAAGRVGDVAHVAGRSRSDRRRRARAARCGSRRRCDRRCSCAASRRTGLDAQDVMARAVRGEPVAQELGTARRRSAAPARRPPCTADRRGRRRRSRCRSARRRRAGARAARQRAHGEGVHTDRLDRAILRRRPRR